MPTAELTVQLPPEEAEFLKAYAQQHGTTVTDLMVRYVHKLKIQAPGGIHPDVAQITGLVPAHLDAEAEHRRHLLEKHQ